MQGKVVDDAKSKAAQLVASYGGDSESDEEVEEPALQPPPPLPPSGGKMDDLNLSAIEAKMTDLDKMTCLLCKRLFNTREALLRHQQLSDLHKVRRIFEIKFFLLFSIMFLYELGSFRLNIFKPMGLVFAV